MARFVEEIFAKYQGEIAKKPLREEMMKEIEWYCQVLGMSLPKGYPQKMSDDEMEDWLQCWREFDPCPDV